MTTARPSLRVAPTTHTASRGRPASHAVRGVKRVGQHTPAREDGHHRHRGRSCPSSVVRGAGETPVGNLFADPQRLRVPAAGPSSPERNHQHSSQPGCQHPTIGTVDRT